MDEYSYREKEKRVKGEAAEDKGGNREEWDRIKKKLEEDLKR